MGEHYPRWARAEIRKETLSRSLIDMHVRQMYPKKPCSHIVPQRPHGCSAPSLPVTAQPIIFSTLLVLRFRPSRVGWWRGKKRKKSDVDKLNKRKESDVDKLNRRKESDIDKLTSFPVISGVGMGIFSSWWKEEGPCLWRAWPHCDAWAQPLNLLSLTACLGLPSYPGLDLPRLP